jgi:hypothetical protein
VLAVVVCALAIPAAAPAADGFFTPSRNIICALVAPGTLRCDIGSGLVPEPAGSCDFDWAAVTLRARGPARPACISDSVFDDRFPVLGYGRTWRKGPFTCRSARSGVTCRNTSRHGFLLSRVRWRRLAP